MAGRNRTATLEALRRTIQEKECELCELDLMLADYHTERYRLIRELRRLRAEFRDAREPARSVSRPSPDGERAPGAPSGSTLQVSSPAEDGRGPDGASA